MQKTLMTSLSLAVVIAGLLFISCIKGAGSGPIENKKLDKIIISTPVATISIPVAYIIDKGFLKEYADKVEMVIWDSNEKFRAQVLGNSADFITMPVNAACLFHNKGISLKMMKIAMWKLFYIVSKDDSVKSIKDLVGKKIVIPFRGDVPDTLFQYLCQTEHINPFKEINMQYVPSLLDTTASVIGGQSDYAVMIEPAASMAIIKAKEKRLNLKRVIDLQEEWSKRTGIGGGKMPISGIAVLPHLAGNRELLNAFSRAYDEGVKWANDHPEEAARLAVKYFEGINAPAIEESLKYVYFDSKSTADVQKEIETMFDVFLKVNPDSIGGKLPDADFYFK